MGLSLQGFGVAVALYLSLGAASAPEAVIVAEGAIQPHVAIAPDGTIHVVFVRNGNIEIASSSDRGKTYRDPVTAIDARGNAKGGYQRGPRVGIDEKGAVYVSASICFDEDELKKKYPAPELYLTRSTDGGKTFRDPVQINEVSKKAPEGLHWMAVASSGDVHLAWLDNRSPEKSTALYYAKVTDGGEKVGENLKISEPLCECCAPGLAVDGRGNPYVVYREGGDKSSREIFLAVSRDGGSTFGPPKQVNSRPTGLGG